MITKTLSGSGSGDVDDAEVAAGLRSTEGDPRALVARAIFTWVGEDIFHLGFRHVVPVDVRLAGRRG